jgi:DNA ligase-1
VEFGNVEDLQGITRSHSETKWDNIILYISDAPLLSETYEMRLDYLKKTLDNKNMGSRVKLVEPILCKDFNHLQSFMAEVVLQGKEGIMLRKPNSLYESGRSNTLLKWKVRFFKSVLNLLRVSMRL